MKKKSVTIILIISLLGNMYFTIDKWYQNKKNESLWEEIFYNYTEDLELYQSGLEDYFQNEEKNQFFIQYQRSLARNSGILLTFNNKKNNQISEKAFKLANLLSMNNNYNDQELTSVLSEIENFTRFHSELRTEFLSNNITYKQLLDSVEEKLTKIITSLSKIK